MAKRSIISNLIDDDKLMEAIAKQGSRQPLELNKKTLIKYRNNFAIILTQIQTLKANVKDYNKNISTSVLEQLASLQQLINFTELNLHERLRSINNFNEEEYKQAYQKFWQIQEKIKIKEDIAQNSFKTQYKELIVQADRLMFGLKQDLFQPPTEERIGITYTDNIKISTTVSFTTLIRMDEFLTGFTDFFSVNWDKKNGWLLKLSDNVSFMDNLKNVGISYQLLGAGQLQSQFLDRVGQFVYRNAEGKDVYAESGTVSEGLNKMRLFQILTSKKNRKYKYEKDVQNQFAFSDVSIKGLIDISLKNLMGSPNKNEQGELTGNIGASSPTMLHIDGFENRIKQVIYIIDSNLKDEKKKEDKIVKKTVKELKALMKQNTVNVDTAFESTLKSVLDEIGVN